MLSSSNLNRPRRPAVVILVAILVVGFSLRAWNIFSQGHLSSDGLLYYELSRGLIEEGRVLSGKAVRTVVTRSNLEFYDNLFLQGKYGYMLLILISFLVAGVKLETVLYLNLFLGTATLFAIFLLGKTVFNEKTGLVATAIGALSLVLINYSRVGLTSSGSMFFFTMGLVFFFRHLKGESSCGMFHRLFFSGILIGYAFTIHYNLAYYFLLVYFSHLALVLFSRRDYPKQLRENLILASGLILPLVVFEFGYPIVYYVIYKKHVLFTYFQEVLYNALEAGGGSLKWNYFILFLSLAESPAFCVLVFFSMGWFLFYAFKDRDIFKGLLFLFAFFPPFFLSFLDFPLVGRNLAPSLPLIVVMIGFQVLKVAEWLAPKQFGWSVSGLILGLMGLGLFHLPEGYRIQSPMVQAREDLKNRPVLLLGKDELYREAILYQVSDEISVVPSFESILKDPDSKKYFLLTKPESVKKMSCDPWKTYLIFNKDRFRPIRYEDRISEQKSQPKYREFFSIYDLTHCLASDKASAIPMKRSVTLIGLNYSVAQSDEKSPAKMHFGTGNEYLKADHLEEAIYELKKTLQYNPSIIQAHNNLAFAFIKKGLLEEALIHLKEADRLTPGMLETQNLFGLNYIRKGELDRAIHYFEKAMRINPNHPIAYQYLLEIYLRLDNNPKKVRIYSAKLEELNRKKNP